MSARTPQASTPALADDAPTIQLGAGFDFASPDSPLAPYYLRSSDVAAVFLVSLVFVLACVAPLPRGDVRLQLDLGHEALNGGWTLDPARQLSWAFSAGLMLVFRLGGWLSGSQSTDGGVECLRGVYALFVAARLAFLWLAFRRVSRSSGVALVGLALTLILSLGRLPRLQPLLFGEVCFAALLLVLSYRELTLRLAQCIGVMFVLWANVHESFVLGFFLIGIALTARLIQVRGRWFGDTYSLRLTGLLLVCLSLVAVFNPRGPFLAHTIWQLAHDPAFLALDAWRPLRFHYGPGGQWTFVILWLLVVLTQHTARTFYEPLQLLCLLVFGFWPLWHQQALLEWAMVAPWCVASLASVAATRSAWLDYLPESVPCFRKTILAALLLLIAATWFPPIHWLMGGKPAPRERSLTQSR